LNHDFKSTGFKSYPTLITRLLWRIANDICEDAGSLALHRRRYGYKRLLRVTERQ